MKTNWHWVIRTATCQTQATPEGGRSPARRIARLALCALAIAQLIPSSSARAQETVTLDDILEGSQQWLKDNLDPQVLRQIDQNIDTDRARSLLRDLQSRLQGDYVVDIARLRQTARALVPILESTDETRPYAIWLNTRLDYFDVAQELRLSIPTPKPQPGKPPPPTPNPDAARERSVWRRQMEKRPPPRGADVYVRRLKPVFGIKRVPGELVWLAEVESGFDPRARSPAGAVGLFQLMPATAQRFGLALKPRDERLDADRNAQAAAEYLRLLHGRFKDWRLALAAYNAGEGRVGKLLESQKAASYDRIATRLPAETQMYVPKIDAVLQRREGVTLADLKSPAR